MSGDDRTDSKERRPLDHWAYRADRRAGILRLRRDFIAEARDIVVDAFDREWLEEEFRRSPQGFGFVSPHPMVENFMVAGDPQISEIMEIAVYLKRLAGTPGLADVTRMIRERAQFATTLLQLAYAYRFKRSGATVDFEPEAAKGRKADIGLVIGGSRYLAECYVPEIGGKTALRELAEYSIPKLFQATNHLGLTARIRLELKRDFETPERINLEVAVREALRKVKEKGRVTTDNSVAMIVVEDISDVNPDPDWPGLSVDRPASVPGEADFVVSEMAVASEDLERVRDGDKIKKHRGSRILIRWPKAPDQETSERTAELSRRLRAKLPQTKAAGAGRILVAQIPEAIERGTSDEAVVREVGAELLNKHSGIEAMIFTARVWSERLRFRYQGYVVYPPTSKVVPGPLLETLNQLDRSVDLLEDWR
jgi:hypothetical protein